MKRATCEGHFVNRRRNLFVPPIVLDKTSDVPLYRQIAREITRAISGGTARRHDRLPSTRMLAKMLDVSRNTVLAAYDDLVAEALISGRTGAGMRIEGGAGTDNGLEQIVRASHYPAKTLAVTDPDGNSLYIRF
jgi:DNA-binding transcriptional regulator YhcF (GntR family)